MSTELGGAPEVVPGVNWAGNVSFRAAMRERPTEVPALQGLVARSRRIRTLGTGHSFSPIVDSQGVLVSLAGLPRTIDVDRDRRVVAISGHWTYGQLARELAPAGLALANMASLPHISVAGACATGTHGSGVANQALGAAVRALTLVTATGDLVRVGRDHAAFDGSVLALGRLGVVLELELDLVPAFGLTQTVVEQVPDARVATELEAILASAYSVSVFTTWGPDRTNQVWVKELADRGLVREQWSGRLADGPRHPVAGMPTENATPQLGQPGPSHERLPHFRLEFKPSSGDELQSEYLLPMARSGEAWAAIDEVREELHPLLHVSEIRAVAPDSMWLSLTGGAPSVAFHFTWRTRPEVLGAVGVLERQLAPYDARPHWGKVFSTPAERLARLYPRLPSFRRLVTDMDPKAKFTNDLVDRCIGL